MLKMKDKQPKRQHQSQSDKRTFSHSGKITSCLFGNYRFLIYF